LRATALCSALDDRMSDSLKAAAVGIQIAFASLGVILAWRHVFSPKARAARAPSPLPHWEISRSDFAVFCVVVVTSMFGATTVGGVVAKSLGVIGDMRTFLLGACAQLGMLGAVFGYLIGQPSFRPTPVRTGPNIFLAGAATLISKLVLELAGVPNEQQDLIRMFARTESAWVLALIIVFAAVVAPFTEEYIFRAGLFRFLRTRIVRWLAYLFQATFFAAIHGNLLSFLPLLVLAVAFAAAYERTGRIGTAVVAHACFNLNTVLVLLLTGGE
jgi:membrane protease YdiL (CAAX protease family)